MKNKNFFESVVCAIRGIISGFKTEKNFKIYIFIALIFLVFNIILSAENYDYIILIVLTSGVFTAEYFNTAAERIVDKFSNEINNDFKFIKDVAAGAVLISGIAFFSVEAIVLISKLIG